MAKIPLQEKYKLPNNIQVGIHKSKNGYTAILPNYPGCVTYAKSLSELVENVNDAILTYFEVPRKEALKAEFIYTPHNHKQKVQSSKKQHMKVKSFSEFISVFPRLSYV